MKIMLDTNVIISALIFGGKAGKLLELPENMEWLFMSRATGGVKIAKVSKCVIKALYG